MDLLIVAANDPASPWNAVTITTAVVAGLAALVGLGGLILGIVNSSHQRSRDFPRVHWAQEWDNGAPDEEISAPGKRFYLENVGRGTAHQVKLERWMPAYQGRPGRWNVLHAVEEVPFGKSIAQWFVDPEARDLRITYYDPQTGGGGTYPLEDYWVWTDDGANLRVSWREGASLQRIHYRRYRRSREQLAAD